MAHSDVAVPLSAPQCPYPGCGKDFSRHDNLGQHMRVHKGFQMPKGSRL